jgi:phage FluMu protein Com
MINQMTESNSNQYIQYQCYSCRELCTARIPDENTDEFLKDMLDPNKYKLCQDCWDALQMFSDMGYLDKKIEES